MLLLALDIFGAASVLHAQETKLLIPDGFYRLASAVKLPGKSPDWDYLAFDAAREHLFIARRGAGLWVYDTRKQKLITKITNSIDAGGALLLPALDRGYTSNEDGSTTVFSLSTLKTIRRVKFADDADAASFDSVTGRIAFVSADSQKITFVDPTTLAVLGTLALEAKKADGSAADGAGHILLNQRDTNSVLRIDAATGKIMAEWPTTGCTQPTAIAYDAANHRAFIGCRGAVPVLAVMNTDTGAVVKTLDLGRGNDGIVYDAARHRIIATNGVEANIVIFLQDDADHYRLEQAITTRPFARTIAYDQQSGRIFTVAAEGVVNPAKHINTGPSAFYPNAYYDDSFTVLTYAPNNTK